jgi:hypothetical protein
MRRREKTASDKVYKLRPVPQTIRARRLALHGTICAAVIAGAASRAEAAEPWIQRGLVLPRGHVALDVGIGYGGWRSEIDDSVARGWALNVEAAAGLPGRLEIGVRTGIRLDEGSKVGRSDRFARPFDTETWGTRSADVVANPEVRLRWSITRTPRAEYGLEGRAFIPTEPGMRFGFMLALPMAFRNDGVRFDTGLFVPVLFTESTSSSGEERVRVRIAFSVPMHLWFQASRFFWLGPVSGLFYTGQMSTPIGFGAGAAVWRTIDLRAWIWMPAPQEEPDYWGVGGGLQFRYE